MLLHLVAWITINRYRVDVYENAVASVVDVTSILIAYTIGVNQMGFIFGIAYALFDAWMVVWMRKPIFSLVKKIMGKLKGKQNKLYWVN
ncbi:MAG: hypothetical protein QXV84_05290 [Conexivisphaerales archaeon]